MKHAQQSLRFTRHLRQHCRWLVLVILCFGLWPANEAHAAKKYQDIPAGTCTTQNGYGFEIPVLKPNEGLISGIVRTLTLPLEQMARLMFNAITNNPGYQNVLRIASSIYVAIFGIFFMFGMIQITVHDLFMRFIKLGIINVLLSANSWDFFYTVVVRFFNDGVTKIIEFITAVGYSNTLGGFPAATGDPFFPMDQALITVVSTKMVVTLIATFFTGPYGMVIGFILLMSLGSFLKSIFQALWVYVMALVIRTLMFGLAPIFLACMLFSRTRHLFEGWLNQIVNSSLQPIFLFTFFTFFVTLLGASISLLLQRPVCLMPAEIQLGTPQVWNTWRFAIRDCIGNGTSGIGDWIPSDAKWDFNGLDAEYKSCNPEIHPIGILLPIMIWILADLAGRFMQIVLDIAKDLANASTDMTMGADQIGAWFNKAISGAGAAEGGGSAGKTGSRDGAGALSGLEKIVNNVAGKANEAKPGQMPAQRANPSANPQKPAGSSAGTPPASPKGK